MSAWKVYSKNGSVERCELKSLEYGGTAMGERAVTATFHYHSEVDFEVFDYIEYRGEKFELEAVPTVKKVSSFEYIYELHFVSLKYELERCEMRDLVPYDNEVVYPTPLTFSFTGNVRYLTERIQACLDALYGSGTWNIIIADGVESEEKNITIAQQNCWNALALVSSTYGLSFYIKGRTITIGGEQPLVGHTFEYGKGNGLYEIERASDTNTGIVTKLRAYGSTRNLDYSYPKRPEWSDSALPVTFAFSPLRLMLPSFKTDGKTDYVLADSATIAKYGIREASMVYDDIYPSITGATYNGQAIDEIKGVEEVDDNSDSFVVYLHDLGFDLEEHLTTADAQISMKTGAMQGYTFTITKIEKQYENTATADITDEENPDEGTPEGDTPEENLGEFVGYRITLNRISAEGGENYNIPNSDWSMKAGDKFVLLNILMPQMYIREAENRLDTRAKEYLAQYGKTNFSYNVGLHDKFLIENPSVYDSLIEGSKLRVRDTEIGIDEEVTIQSITIAENAEGNILPQVKVTLNNESSASTLERIQGRIDALANESAAGNFATQSEIAAQYRKKLDKPYFDKLFVAVDANGKDIPSNDMTTPVAYIKAKYHFAVVGGITSFVNDADLDLPSIYDGLPIDCHTLYWDEIKEETGTDEEGNPIYKTTKVLKAKGGNGGNTGGNSIQFALNWDGYSKGSWDGSTSETIYIPTVDEIKTEIDKLYLPLTGGTLTGDLEIYGKLQAFNVGKDYDIETERIQVKGGVSGIALDWANTFPDSSNKERPRSGLSMTESMKYDSVILSGVYGIKFRTNGKNYPFYFDGGNVGIGGLAENSYKLDVYGDTRVSGDIYINGGVIRYNASAGYFYLDGDLLVSGGITSYASEEGFEPGTIMDALRVDGTNLKVVNGVLTFVGTTGGGTGGLDESEVKNIIESYKYVKVDTLNIWSGSSNISTVGIITSGTWQGTPISNSRLANSSIEIAGTDVSLGSSITSSSLKTALGLDNTLTMDAVDVYISALQNQIDGLWKRNWFNDLHSNMLITNTASVAEFYGDNVKANALVIGDCLLMYDSANNALTIQKKDGTAMNVLVTGGLTSYSTKV